jgi:hypothetical protein
MVVAPSSIKNVHFTFYTGLQLFSRAFLRKKSFFMKKVYYFDYTMPEYSGCGKHNAAAKL